VRAEAADAHHVEVIEMTKQPVRKNDGSRGKKRYAKPDIRQVALRPEEAVLGACKTATLGGPGQTKCNTPSNCHSISS
jgi:hypothetical protein